MKIKTTPAKSQSFPSLRNKDLVRVLSGKDRGKEGKILKVDRMNNKVLVEDVNKITKAVKPDQSHPQGGFIVRENYLGVSRVMLICPRCQKPTRVGHQFLADGKKVRICRHCQEHIDK
ncbi:MAG: 50S ribosomal protein L24 [Leptospirales bacterium]